jgi:hypothetical protein
MIGKHFTLRTNYLFRHISAFVAGVFLKLCTSHSPRVRYKPCRLYLVFHWRDFHYVTFLLMRCTRCMFGCNRTFFYLFAGDHNRNDHALLCTVLYNFLLLLHISTCHFPKDLTFVYDCHTVLPLCFHYKPFKLPAE